MTGDDKQLYQQILDGLCDAHSVPRISIFVCEKLDGMHGDFDGDKYFIRLEVGAPIDKLYHEFTHYLIRLINVAGTLEENICDYSSQGIIKDVNKNNPLIKDMVNRLS